MKIELINQMSAETKLAKSMVALLDKERDALADSNSQLINQLAVEKRNMLAELENLAKKRLQLVAQMGYRKNAGSVQKFLAQQDPSQALAKSWESLHEYLQICADKNLVNGRIISLSQRKTEVALNVLRGQFNQNNAAYNRMGKVTHQAYGSTVTSA